MDFKEYQLELLEMAKQVRVLKHVPTEELQKAEQTLEEVSEELTPDVKRSSNKG